MVRAMDFYNLLPKTNCEKCPQKSCMAFAMALLKNEAKLEECLPVTAEEFQENREKLLEILETIKGAEASGLIVHEELCDGCANCLVACPVNVVDPKAAGGKGPDTDDVILKVINGRVKIVKLEKCRRVSGEVATKTCRVCGDACPKKAFEFI
ncbi:MAG: (Fe-S)-binding protein [Methanopyri archaeon]|nr:(Fe-S)-binding protein [Methanopyri archaeon]